MVRQLLLELEDIRAELAPPHPEQRSVLTPDSPTGNAEEPPAAVPSPELPVLPEQPRLLHVPTPVLPVAPSLPSAEQVDVPSPLTLRRRLPSPAGERRLPADPRPGAFLSQLVFLGFSFGLKRLKVLLGDVCAMPNQKQPQDLSFDFYKQRGKGHRQTCKFPTNL